MSTLASLLDDICFILVADDPVRSPSGVAPTSTHWALIFFPRKRNISLERVHELRVSAPGRVFISHQRQELRVKRQLAPPAEYVILFRSSRVQIGDAARSAPEVGNGFAEYGGGRGEPWRSTSLPARSVNSVGPGDNISFLVKGDLNSTI